MMHNSFQEIINFWFEEIKPVQWWKKDQAFDQLIKNRFLTLHRKACQGELSNWRDSALGRLAEIIILDQFSRNIFRDKAEAFSQDPQALCLAQHAIALGADLELNSTQRNFMYLPFMHSESIVIHEYALKLYQEKGSPDNLEFERKHKYIIDQFGRYPHRNEILGRASTPEEIEFLQQPNSSF